MKTIKVMFLSWHFASPKIFLESILKMTPGCSGKWKNIEATLDMEKADYFIVMDGYKEKFPTERALYFGQHPKGGSPSFKDYKNTPCLKAFPLDKYLNPGEWWIKYDYDYLSALDPPKKTKNLCCIMTYQPGYDQSMMRINFMHEVIKHIKDIDLYGRPEENFRADEQFKEFYKGCLGYNKYDGYKGEHLIGKEKVGDYRYSLEFDQGPTTNYFSERFYDAMLLYSCPLYFGSNNIHKFLPENSFRYVDITKVNEDEIKNIVNIVNSNFREQNMKALKEARYKLLNEYQTWSYILSKIQEL